MKKIQLILLLILISITTYSWFLDGYYQPIDPDTFGEMNDAGLDMKFPEMLTAHTNYHSKWFAKALPYVSFTTVGTIYNAITGNKAESLFVTQGFMTALTYVMFIFISAYYISLCASPLSSGFILSYLFVAAFILLGGNIVFHSDAFVFRFYHISVMGNYMWTFNVLMLAFLPYWRYFITLKWSDWHDRENPFLKTLWLLSIIFCAFSSSCSTVVALYLSCFIIMLLAINNFYQNKSASGIIQRSVDAVLKIKHEMYYGLYVLIVLCIISLVSEKTGLSGQESKTYFTGSNFMRHFVDYCYIWKEFLFTKSYLLAYGVVILLTISIGIYLWRLRNSQNKSILVKLVLIALFLMFTSVTYSFVIGTQQLPYRFRGTNLGGDTLLYFSWSLMFIILSFTVYFLVNTRFKILAPILIFVAISHIVPSFSNHPYYAAQRKEMNGFNMVYNLDKINTNDTILIPKSYDDALNMWGNGAARLTYFAAKTKLTKTERKFVIVDDNVFFEYYNPYFPQLEDIVVKY